jgi:predicted GNAT family acetyltransferase
MRTDARVAVVHGAEARCVLARLARFHYRVGEPASPSRVMVVLDARGEHVGVLCTAYPTLNGPWRKRAWPGLLARACSNRARARVLNDHVRTIARVIVDPRWRGVGIAAHLVRAYLNDPETPLTEAVASMGRFCPFFESAGMRRVEAARSERDTRLSRGLSALGIDAASLVDIGHARIALRRTPALAALVRSWAGASKSTRRHARDGRLVELCVLAAQGAAGHGPVVYVTP